MNACHKHFIICAFFAPSVGFSYACYFDDLPLEESVSRALSSASFCNGYEPEEFDVQEIPEYEGNISITYPDNGEFAEFLSAHSNQVVKLVSHIDMSISNELSHAIADTFGIDNFIENPAIPLPLNGIDGDAYVQFHFRQSPQVSFGGTGVVQFAIHGYFIITTTESSEPKVTYHLNEVVVAYR